MDPSPRGHESSGTELGASWRVLDADGPYPFVLATAQLAFVTTRAENGATHERDALTAFLRPRDVVHAERLAHDLACRHARVER